MEDMVKRVPARLQVPQFPIFQGLYELREAWNSCINEILLALIYKTLQEAKLLFDMTFTLPTTNKFSIIIISWGLCKEENILTY